MAKKQYLCTRIYIIYNMDSKHLNRIKVVLAEKDKSNKWLAEQLGKDQATIPSGLRIQRNLIWRCYC